jgi:hypothetical protein
LPAAFFLTGEIAVNLSVTLSARKDRLFSITYRNP